MINHWLKKIKNTKNIFHKILERCDICIKSISTKIPDAIRYHLCNIFILLGVYFISSAFIYEELSLLQFFKEFFAILCSYGAVFVWFVDNIKTHHRFRIFIAVTACVAPMFFINNTFSVAIIVLFVIMLFEYIVIQYIRGCKLFSNKMPIYVVCNNEDDLSLATFEEYKVLELIVLNSKTNNFSSIKDIQDMGKILKKLNCFSFFPTPKRIIYCSNEINTEVLKQLLDLSSEYSIPLLKISDNKTLLPITFFDFDCYNVSSHEKSQITSAFKEKNVTICYDGRDVVLDLIGILSNVNSINLTVICESEILAIEVEKKLYSKNLKIIVTDIDIALSDYPSPDVLFYNIPIKTCRSSGDNLKEAVIKNVAYTKKIISIIHSLKTPLVYVLSDSCAMNCRNWVGATQKLGELFFQFADSQNRKYATRFKVIRIPNCASDSYGMLGKLKSSIIERGTVEIDWAHSDVLNTYYKKDILPLLLKIVPSTKKAYDAASNVFSIIPDNCINPDELIKIVCNLFSLRKNHDVKVKYKNSATSMDLEDFPNITDEKLEKTTVDHVFCTKFNHVTHSAYDDEWNIEEINKMSTRDLITAVYQSISVKLKK